MTIYKSKIDYWLVVLIYILILVAAVPTLIYAFSWTALLLNTLLLILVTALVFGTKYIIDKETLYIKCSILLIAKCSIQKIATIRNTNTNISAPAVSLDRIALKLSNRETYIISPQKKQEFITHLLSINSNIIIR